MTPFLLTVVNFSPFMRHPKIIYLLTYFTVPLLLEEYSAINEDRFQSAETSEPKM